MTEESNKLYVGSLNWDTTDDSLYCCFEKIGKISEGKNNFFCVFSLLSRVDLSN